jgi:putative membrane protein
MSTRPDHLESSNELASTRTLMAADRTLMAWTRTALAMISFGFTIFKFLHGMHAAGALHLRRPEEPRNMGLFLTSLGIASLLAGLFEHLKTLGQVEGRRPRLRASFYVACLVLLLGIFVLAGLLTQRGAL